MLAKILSNFGFLFGDQFINNICVFVRCFDADTVSFLRVAKKVSSFAIHVAEFEMYL